MSMQQAKGERFFTMLDNIMKYSYNDAHNCHCLKHAISKNSSIPIEDLTCSRLGREFK